jgi:integrase
MRREQYRVWDGGSDPVSRGLCVLVSPAGARSYRSTFYFPGSSAALSRHLGRVGEMSLDEAREQNRQDRANARKGIDPRTRTNTGEDFEATVKDYVKREQVGAKNNASAPNVERMILKECAEWKRRDPSSIRPQEVQSLLESTRDRAPYVANLLYARLATFFSWCARPAVGKVAASPMVGIGKPWNGEKRRTRDWFKGDRGDEMIKCIWAGAAKLEPVEGQHLKIGLILGKRKSALAEMLWEEIDKDWFWNAPEGSHNKRLHGVPLPSLAQRVLGKRKAKGLVFPDLRVNRAYDDRLKEAVGADDFFFHGLRHVAETKLGELKVLPHIRDCLFDHIPKRGSGVVYDHHEYEEEMLAALEQWSAHIERLVQPKGAALLR